jgi:lipopolysaccharide transport system ATP-binding protein
MSFPVIKVDNISKQFIIAHEAQERYTTLRDSMVRKARKLFSFSGPAQLSNAQASKETFWALKEVDFEIEMGARVGIIGRNGAGKSTLLKILSRITEPTSGRISLRGRVASLLEVGTGFHPELTGRENIYLNGAILGMGRAEIRKKFDEIVNFAEIEKFLDTPVKRYSSGMYVKLAFAVAAHLEPEILIVDEVLAVGDAQFQKKCLGKMEQVSTNEGRTVLFVSHNMAAVKTLCNTAVILHQGKKILQGGVSECLAAYYTFDQNEKDNSNVFQRENIPASQKMYIAGLRLIEDHESEELRINISLNVVSKVDTRIGVNIRLKDGMGFPLGYGSTTKVLPELFMVKAGSNQISFNTAPLHLATGKYKISLELVIPGVEYLDKVDDCVAFELSNDSVSPRSYVLSQEWGYGSMEIEFDNIKIG